MFIEVAEGPSMDTQVDVVMIFPIDTLNFQQGKGVHTTLVLAILRVSDRPLGDGKCWWPFGKVVVKWPPTGGWKGHFESPGYTLEN